MTLHRLLRHWPFVMRLPGYGPGETQCLCEACGAMWLERKSIWFRHPTWQWHLFKPLRGTGYRAFWFGPFKIIVRD